MALMAVASSSVASAMVKPAEGAGRRSATVLASTLMLCCGWTET